MIYLKKFFKNRVPKTSSIGEQINKDIHQSETLMIINQEPISTMQETIVTETTDAAVVANKENKKKLPDFHVDSITFQEVVNGFTKEKSGEKFKYVATGVATGKTWAMCQYLASVNQRTVIVVPTVALVSEWVNKLNDLKVDVIAIVSDPNAVDQENNAVYAELTQSVRKQTVNTRIATIMGTDTMLEKEQMVIVCTAKSFAAAKIPDSVKSEWHVVYDESPTVMHTIRYATKDQLNFSWISKYIKCEKVVGGGSELFRCTAKGTESLHILDSNSPEDSSRRRIIAPLHNASSYSVFCSTKEPFRNLEIAETLAETVGVEAAEQHKSYKHDENGSIKLSDKVMDGDYFIADFCVVHNIGFYIGFASMTIMAADLMDRDFYEFAIQNGIEFVEATEVIALMDQDRLNRDYKNVTVHYICDTTRSLSKSMLKNSVGMIADKLPGVVKKIVDANRAIKSDDEKVNVTNNKNNTNLNVAIEKMKNINSVSSASAGINNPEWIESSTAIFLSAINTDNMTTAIRSAMCTNGDITKHLRNRIAFTSAYQTLGRSKVRTEKFNESESIDFYVFSKPMADYVSSKFKGSKVSYFDVGIDESMLVTRISTSTRSDKINKVAKSEEEAIIMSTSVKNYDQNSRKLISSMRKKLQKATITGVIVRRSSLSPQAQEAMDKFRHYLSEDLLNSYDQLK